MYKIFITIIISLFIYSYSYAVVPTTDVYKAAQDGLSVEVIQSTITHYIDQMQKAKTLMEELKELSSLNNFAKTISTACDLNICTKEQRTQMLDYINQVNNDLCTQFNKVTNALNAGVGTANSINDILTKIRIVASMNPETAKLLIQQAAAQTEAQIKNMLLQAQVLAAQQTQKQMVEQKIEKSNTDAIYSGFKNAGL